MLSIGPYSEIMLRCDTAFGAAGLTGVASQSRPADTQGEKVVQQQELHMNQFSDRDQSDRGTNPGKPPATADPTEESVKGAESSLRRMFEDTLRGSSTSHNGIDRCVIDRAGLNGGTFVVMLTEGKALNPTGSIADSRQKHAALAESLSGTIATEEEAASYARILLAKDFAGQATEADRCALHWFRTGFVITQGDLVSILGTSVMKTPDAVADFAGQMIQMEHRCLIVINATESTTKQS